MRAMLFHNLPSVLRYCFSNSKYLAYTKHTERDRKQQINRETDRQVELKEGRKEGRQTDR